MTTPTWPSNLNNLAERGSWNKSPNEPVLRSEFDNGPARARRRFTRQITTISFTVQMTEEEHEAFEGFFQDDLRSGAVWFNMSVYLGRRGYETTRVRFTEPYQVRDAGFRHVKILAKLEAIMTPLLSGGAAYFVATYGEADIDAINDELSPLVNIQYPEATGSY